MYLQNQAPGVHTRAAREPNVPTFRGAGNHPILSRQGGKRRSPRTFRENEGDFPATGHAFPPPISDLWRDRRSGVTAGGLAGALWRKAGGPFRRAVCRATARRSGAPRWRDPAPTVARSAARSCGRRRCCGVRCPVSGTLSAALRCGVLLRCSVPLRCGAVFPARFALRCRSVLCTVAVTVPTVTVGGSARLGVAQRCPVSDAAGAARR